MTLSTIASVTGGMLSGSDREFVSVSIDSRAVQNGDLFVAIRGDRFDGHDFVDDAMGRGAAGAVVSRRMASAISQVTVSDTTTALGSMAAYWRRQFDLPVLGITGSNGKTTVTAMIREILSVSGLPLAPRESFNNQWGVPLTLLGLRESHTHAVIEMGMNHPGEIDYLTRIAAPTVALINNAAAAHLEGLGTVERVARAKAEIFNGLEPDGCAVLNRDDDHYALWRSMLAGQSVVTFGGDATADIRCEGEIDAADDGCRFALQGAAGSAVVALAVPGRHNMMNALAAIACCHAAGIALDDMVAGLARFHGVPGRLRRLVSASGAALVDDSFNANPASVQAAIDFLATRTGKRILVLGAMAELGVAARDQHARVGSYAWASGIDRLLVLNDRDNPDLEGYRRGFGDRTEICRDVPQLLDALGADNRAGNTILIKGSKASAMGRVVEALAGRDSPGGQSC